MDISAITDDLYVGGQPHARDLAQLEALGVRLIITLRALRNATGRFAEPAVPVLWLRTVDSPLTPIPTRTFLKGVQAALDVIRAGGRVFVHCKHGRHRSVAMAACILIAQGDTAEQAMQRLTHGRRRADPHIWYIRQQIERFERHWKKLKGAG
ncbi:MAG: dual specificity protein phosphatase family protein [Anaerolineales bacterium]|nr:dual specificity protein phosphatase family protein [Anaerolineales bacterium]